MTDEDLQRLLVLDGSAGPALPIGAAQTAAIIDAALDGAGFGPGGGGGGSSSGARGGAAAGGMKLAIVAAVAVVVIVIALLAWRGTRRRTAQLAVTPPDAAQIDAAAGSGTIAVTEPADAAVVEPTVAEDIAIDPTPTSPPSNPPRRAKDRDPKPVEDATDLLGEANAKRAAKQWKESDALYARVVDRAPKSLAAQTALIASASLHLEHLGDPKGAAQRFRRALAIAPAGALAEEARWGIAEAARANHDATAEAAALDEFLAHHGRSPLAERARTRRAELP
jgi:hypothetical protein